MYYWDSWYNVCRVRNNYSVITSFNLYDYWSTWNYCRILLVIGVLFKFQGSYYRAGCPTPGHVLQAEYILQLFQIDADTGLHCSIIVLQGVSRPWCTKQRLDVHRSLRQELSLFSELHFFLRCCSWTFVESSVVFTDF